MDNIPLLAEPLSVPLCVDLDGTLIQEDTTRTAFFLYCGKNPLRYFEVAFWFLYRRHAYMKKKLAEKVDLTNHKWTFNEPVFKMLAQEKKAGRKIYLVSATDIQFALSVIKQDPCKSYFSNDTTLATNGRINYRAAAKADLLDHKFGKHNFVYIGNSHDDLKVWTRGQTAVVMSYKTPDPLVQELKTLVDNVITLRR